jgi:ribosomal protein S18 acetylase RimI-like enzyme
MLSYCETTKEDEALVYRNDVTRNYWFSLMVYLICLTQTHGFLIQQSDHHRYLSPRIGLLSTELQLIPIRKFHDEFTFLSQSPEYTGCIQSTGRFVPEEDGDDTFELGLVEEKDLIDLSRFIVQVFGGDAIRISQDTNAFERMLMTPAVELVNGYSGMIAFAEVLVGLRQRLAFRFRDNPNSNNISPPNLQHLSNEEQIQMAAQTSLVLILAKPDINGETVNVNIIASVELRLQPCDAKIPFTWPWIDRMERRLGSWIGMNNSNHENLEQLLYPYLSNLCVDESYRSKGIGRSLVRCVENIAATCWGYKQMYLHVDPDNQAAFQLYQSEGYRDVGRRWNPFWSGNAAKIAYLYKNLDRIKPENTNMLGANKYRQNQSQ